MKQYRKQHYFMYAMYDGLGSVGLTMQFLIDAVLF